MSDYRETRITDLDVDIEFREETENGEDRFCVVIGCKEIIDERVVFVLDDPVTFLAEMRHKIAEHFYHYEGCGIKISEAELAAAEKDATSLAKAAERREQRKEAKAA